MTRHVMVDLETLGLTPDSVVLSIGAVVFDATTTHSEHHWVLNPDQPGRRIDPNTVKWWLNQSDAARNAITHPKEMWTLGRALDDFGYLFDTNTRIWSNGANFDIPILEHVYARAFGPMTPPWKYKNTRCYRTVRAMFPSIGDKVNSTDEEHNALDDARHQVRVLQYACTHKGFSLP